MNYEPFWYQTKMSISYSYQTDQKCSHYKDSSQLICTRNSHLEVSYKKTNLKNSGKFTRKCLCQNLTVACWRLNLRSSDYCLKKFMVWLPRLYFEIAKAILKFCNNIWSVRKINIFGNSYWLEIQVIRNWFIVTIVNCCKCFLIFSLILDGYSFLRHLVCTTNQAIRFCIKCKFGLKWINMEINNSYSVLPK